MKKSFVLIVILFSALRSFAAPYDHIHLAASNSQEAVNWYLKHFGGEAARLSRSTDTSLPIDRVMYGDIAVVFYGREPGEGSVGSGIDHFGFSMSNVADVVASVVEDGGKQLGDLVEFSGMQIGFVEDPWGTKIEIIDDPELRGMHHLHLTSPDPSATLQWYEQNFGGESAHFKGVLPGLNYGDIWLLVSQARGELAPSAGRSFDHLGWRSDDLSASETELKSNAVEFTMEPLEYRTVRIAFVKGPDGVAIELVEHNN
jgi:catechol 2,3-dioxygenase-like lactoylglutathione lyase family enzyme